MNLRSSLKGGLVGDHCTMLAGDARGLHRVPVGGGEVLVRSGQTLVRELTGPAGLCEKLRICKPS